MPGAPLLDPAERNRKARKDIQTARCDYDDSDAICGAGQLARPVHSDPIIRAKPDDDARRLSLALLPSDDGG